jgi:hypothetical protein
MDQNQSLETPAKDETAEALRALAPLAKAFLENQSKEIANTHAIEMKRNETDFHLERESIALEKFRFNRFFWMLAAVLVFVGVMVWGLVFYLGRVEVGLGLLSHIGMLIIGLLSGMGIQKLRSSDQDS